MIGSRILSIVLLLLIANIACTEQPANGSAISGISLTTDSIRWKLPSRLKEISGLALTPDGRLFSVDDERAIIYEIDYANGRIVKEFALGTPILRGDFEGIAYFREHLLLITSDGLLYSALEGRDGEQVSYSKIDTELGKTCEIEGLAQDPEAGRLLIVCKNMHDDDAELAIFVWRMDDGHMGIAERIELPVSDILSRLETSTLRPSGIAINPLSGSILVIAAKQRALIELDPDGVFLDAIIFPKKKRHRQPEGIEVSRTSKLIISDEGVRSRSRLTVYSSVHAGEKNKQ